MKKKLISLIAVILGFGVAFLFYLKLEPEEFLRKNASTATQKEIASHPLVSFRGHPAGEDLPVLSGSSEFDRLTSMDYVTAIPVRAVPSGIYTLKPWVNAYQTTNRNGRTKKTGRKAETVKTSLQLSPDYLQYYLLELPDGTYLVSLIGSRTASAINRGKRIVLPAGQKIGMTETARQYLSEYSGSYPLSFSGVLDTFDTEWYKEHSFLLTAIRLGTAVLCLFLIAIPLILLGEKLFLKH